MRLVFFTLPGLIVRFNWRFPIGTHRSSASHACNRAADHFIVQPCPHAVGVVIDRAVFTNTKMLCRLDGVNIGAEEQEFPTILALLMLDHLLKLLYEMAVDIMEEGGHDLNPVEASALERAEVARRLNVYLEQLPEYQDRISFVFERK